MSASEIERLEALAKQAHGVTTTAATPETPPPERRSYGFLDLLAVLAMSYALVATTPVGELIVRATGWAAGRSFSTRPLTAYFQNGHGSEVLAPQTQKVLKLARRVGVDESLGRALALVLSEGKEEAGQLVVELPLASRAAFAEAQLKFPDAEVSPKERQRALLKLIKYLEQDLGGREAAAAALAVPVHHVRYAVDRARAADALAPAKFEFFGAYLPPDHKLAAARIVHPTFALVTAFALQWPVDDKWAVSSSFGYRDHPVLGTRKLHTGTDVAVPEGQPIRAASDAVVTVATGDAVNGRYLKLDHGHGLTTAYCHASSLMVSRGDVVKQGEVIAFSGQSGRVTGPHLHFQLELDDDPIDAERFRAPAEKKSAMDVDEPKRLP